MKDGSNTKNGRQVISVSLPAPLYDALMEVVDHYNLNRSDFIARAIRDRLKELGVTVSEVKWVSRRC